MTRIIFAAISIVLLGGLLLSSHFSFNSTAPGKMKIIRFATDATYPPFEYVDKTGNMKGYDIEIANEICKQMKAQCVFVNSSFDKLLTQLNARKIDAIITTMGVSDMRRNEMKFTNVNYNPTLSYVAPLDKKYNAGDIVGKTIGVVQGSQYESYLTNKYKKNVTSKPYVSMNEALQDLQAGKIDMVLGDTMAMKHWLSQDNHSNGYGIIVGPVINNQYFGSGFGIGVRPNDNESLNALNKALIEIKVNGTYDRITRKYFGG
jgi:arginine transport system substrate-binding protein